MSDVLRPYRDLFPQIGQRVMIDDSSVVIGDVRLADDVGIWPLVVIRGDVHYVQIGARTNIQDGSMLNRPGFPGECFICELRLPDHRFRWKHNKLFLLLPEEYGPAFPAIVDCYTSPPT
ncbi:hypothetical protein ECcc95_02760 [Escherichia coli O145:H28]|nr:hypothetical protein ECcc95_02760 [Escherichia coli O145:H28]